MKKDDELIRRIILLIDDQPDGVVPKIEIDGYSEEQISYHCWLIWQQGLAEGHDISGSSPRTGRNTRGALLQSLKPAGHRFAKEVRDRRAREEYQSSSHSKSPEADIRTLKVCQAIRKIAREEGYADENLTEALVNVDKVEQATHLSEAEMRKLLPPPFIAGIGPFVVVTLTHKISLCEPGLDLLNRDDNRRARTWRGWLASGVKKHGPITAREIITNLLTLLIGGVIGLVLGRSSVPTEPFERDAGPAIESPAEPAADER